MNLSLRKKKSVTDSLMWVSCSLYVGFFMFRVVFEIQCNGIYGLCFYLLKKTDNIFMIISKLCENGKNNNKKEIVPEKSKQ